MKNPEMMDIYSDYLIASFSLVTATGLSNLLDNGYSHDKISRFLGQREFSQKDYWQMVKKIIRKIESTQCGILAIDDTIEEKPHSTENELICWHWDHAKNRNVKGINIVNFLYTTSLEDQEEFSIPVSFELVRKTEQYVDTKTKGNPIKRRSSISKNEIVRDRLRVLTKLNRLKYKYITWDSWFSSKDNFKLVHQELKQYFVAALKNNRTAALSEDLKHQGKFLKIKELELQANQTIEVWLKGLDFPVLLAKQVFTNKDGSTGELYIVTNDLELDYAKITSIYQKRWRVETFHKSLKSNAGLEKSPTKFEITQSNHIFASMIAFCKLELLKFKEQLNHFALKSKLYIKAIKAAFGELQKLKRFNPKIQAQQQIYSLGELYT
jgi:hypothetical protein